MCLSGAVSNTPCNSAINLAACGTARPRINTAPDASAIRSVAPSSVPSGDENRSRNTGSVPARIGSGRVMEDDARGAAQARTHATDAMPQVAAVDAPRALHRALMHRDHRGIALAQGQHDRPRLHPRALLGHHELAALEVAAR